MTMMIIIMMVMMMMMIDTMTVIMTMTLIMTTRTEGDVDASCDNDLSMYEKLMILMLRRGNAARDGPGTSVGHNGR